MFDVDVDASCANVRFPIEDLGVVMISFLVRRFDFVAFLMSCHVMDNENIVTWVVWWNTLDSEVENHAGNGTCFQRFC